MIEYGPEERARTYVAIFINAGEKWRNYVPVDGRVNGDIVRIGDVIVTNKGGGIWALTAPGKDTVRLQAAGAP